MALALYRKYRPRTFAEVIGQEHVTEPLSQALRSGRLHHAYLFSGPRGCGKTSSARILARSLNCEQGPTPEPCGVCASCRSLANDGTGSIDVIEIDAASHGGVDDARDLREKAFFAPASSRFKIYVIDEAHMVSSAGFNALLKLVEEPPDYVKFIFATTEPEKVLGTIKSRTHHYPFRLIPPATLRPYLQQLTEAEGVHVEPAVLPLVVRAGGGSARDTLSVLDQLISGAGPEGVTYSRAVSLLGVTDVALIGEMCDSLAAGDGATAYATIDRVAEAGHDPRRFASDLLERFRDLIILQQVPDAVTKGLIDGPADQLDAMTAQATRLGPATLSRCADIVHNGLIEMRGTTAPRLLLELITARMLLPCADDSSGALLHRLERMERRLTLSGDAAGPSNPDSVRAQHTPAPPPQTRGPDAPSDNAPGDGASAGRAGISAARAAAAAAGRRAPATEPSAGQPSSVQASTGGAAQAPSAQVHAVSSEPGSAELGVESAGGRSRQPRSEPSTPGPAPNAASPAADVSVRDDEDWDAEPDDDPYTDDGSIAETGPSAGSRSVGSWSTGEPDRVGGHTVQAPRARRPEPAGLLPDAPEEPDDVATAHLPGQLSAAAIREVWPEIINAVGRQSKKVAALASGATVRDLDGQTVVLTFRFPAHAKLVAAEPDLIVNALYEALGGRWQIRCEIAGEGGAVPISSGGDGGVAAARRPTGGSTPAPPSGTPAQGRPERSTQSATPARRREPEASASASPPSNDDDDWPEPAKPGGLAASASSGGPASGLSGGSGFAGGSDSTGGMGSADGPGSVGDSGSAGGLGSASGSGWAAAPGSLAGPDVAEGPGSTRATIIAGDPASEGGEVGHPSDPDRSHGIGTSAEVDPGNGTTDSRSSYGSTSPADASGSGSAGAASGTAGGVGRTGSGFGKGGPGGGLAAARAAAAGARNGSAPKPGAQPGTAPADAWSDGSAAGEPPYDPEYDGPARAGSTAGGPPRTAAAGSSGEAGGYARAGGPGRTGAAVGGPGRTGAAAGGPGLAEAAAGYEGFDPGDEPLDEVIDERTARQSSQQQAMQLLQDVFGAEKIGES